MPDMTALTCQDCGQIAVPYGTLCHACDAARDAAAAINRPLYKLKQHIDLLRKWRAGSEPIKAGELADILDLIAEALEARR